MIAHIDTNVLCHSGAAFEARMTSLSRLCHLDVKMGFKFDDLFLEEGTLHCMSAISISSSLNPTQIGMK